ncbi:MAG TPA: hypothetical protein VG269_24755 [Tepidisphaeraceae bacterium]|jgi:hypothetical protein|nr:hypothetical protein [Tepidisphaeraceae bacterium]
MFPRNLAMFFLLAALLGSGCAGRPTPPGRPMVKPPENRTEERAARNVTDLPGEDMDIDLSEYPRTEAFSSYTGDHLGQATSMEDRSVGVDDRQFVMTWFSGGDRAAIRYLVSDKGLAVNYRDVYNWARQDQHGRQLTPQALTELHNIVHALPASQGRPPVGHLVLISARDGRDWVTRGYDARRVPPQVEQLLSLLGERFEIHDLRNPVQPPGR